MRSLAHLSPDIEEGTLLVLVQEPDTLETPFTNGWGFDYSIRYFTNDDAMGYVDPDFLYNQKVTVTDEGIVIESVGTRNNWSLAINHIYHWDEIIFLAQDEWGRAVLREELPQSYATEERARLYGPRARLHQSFVDPLFRQLSPPIQFLESRGGR